MRKPPNCHDGSIGVIWRRAGEQKNCRSLRIALEAVFEHLIALSVSIERTIPVNSRQTLVNYLVRLISAVALLTVAFSHVPAVSNAADGIDVSAYAFPDGSVPVLCISGKVDRDDPSATTNPCEYCRLSGAVVLAEPDCGADLLFRLSRPVEKAPRLAVHTVRPVHVASKPLRGPPHI